MLYSFSQLVYFFTIYSFLGWVIEVIYALADTKKFINRGFLFGPFCPIYGFGVVSLITLLQPFSFHPIILFFGVALITSIIEYFTGFILDKIFQSHWWDYSQEKFNLNGYICLRFSLYWGIFGTFLFYFIHPRIQDLIVQSSLNNFWWLPIIMITYFLFDFSLTLKSLIKIKTIYKNFNKIKKHYLNTLEEFRQHNLDLPDFNDIKRDFQKHRKIIRQKIKKFHLVKAFPKLYPLELSKPKKHN